MPIEKALLVDALDSKGDRKNEEKALEKVSKAFFDFSTTSFLLLKSNLPFKEFGKYNGSSQSHRVNLYYTVRFSNTDPLMLHLQP